MSQVQVRDQVVKVGAAVGVVGADAERGGGAVVAGVAAEAEAGRHGGRGMGRWEGCG